MLLFRASSINIFTTIVAVASLTQPSAAIWVMRYMMIEISPATDAQASPAVINAGDAPSSTGTSNSTASIMLSQTNGADVLHASGEAGMLFGLVVATTCLLL